MGPLHFLHPIDTALFQDQRGELSVVEIPDGTSFQTKRVYYISNVPKDSVRGAHAHKKLRQIFICLSGSFTLNVTDGNNVDNVKMTPQSSGYYLQSGYWRELSDFADNSICLVLASEHFDESDYIRNMGDFLVWKSQNES
jgi:dTDP-4-dehydrorhamnose 3,5-epimerase-like enzyme